MSESKLREAGVPIPKKPVCENCPFWRFDAKMTPKTDGVFSASASVQQAGECRLNPPGSLPVQVPGLNPNEIKIEMKRIPVPTLATDSCGQHPHYRAEFIERGIYFAISLWRNWLEYAPGKHPDENAAGFSRMPSFAEAKARYGNGSGAVQGDLAKKSEEPQS